MHRLMPSLDTPDSEEGPVHSCCVRRRNSEVLRTLLRHEAGPIDQDDQRKIVKALADEQAQQQAFAGQLLRGLTGLVLLLHSYLLFQQVLHPWSTRLLAHFYDAGYIFTAFSFLASTAAYGVYLTRLWPLSSGTQQSRLLLASRIAAAASFVLWSLALWKAVEGSGTGWGPAFKFLWLPLGPLLLMTVLEHVWGMVASGSKDVDALSSHMYNFKSA